MRVLDPRFGGRALVVGIVEECSADAAALTLCEVGRRCGDGNGRGEEGGDGGELHDEDGIGEDLSSKCVYVVVWKSCGSCCSTVVAFSLSFIAFSDLATACVESASIMLSLLAMMAVSPPTLSGVWTSYPWIAAGACGQNGKLSHPTQTFPLR